jgi:ferredoxin/coenzyme F420-reducing hydrogenase delta subunit
VFAALERSFDAAFGARANPLRHLGALGFLLFWVMAASGIYLYARFDTSVAGAYESIDRLTREEWWLGGLLRSVHRYAADAFVVVTLLHLVRELAAGRFRGFRTFSWVSGLPLLWLMYASGLVGYWLVWDSRAQFSALATAEWLDALALSAEPIARNFLASGDVADRLFSLFVFLHIGLPLMLLAGMWVHVQRLGAPRTQAPRALVVGTLAMLAGTALAAPVASQARWDPAHAPALLDIDWFMLFGHPLMYATSPEALWVLAGGATLALGALPWLARRKPLAAARVDPANCSGCGRCVADCPYQAVLLAPRAGERGGVLAEVMPARCAGCGICAGACPSSTPFRSVSPLVSGIDLPDRTMHALRRELGRALASRAPIVAFRCASAARVAGAIELRCIAMLPPAFVEYALRHGARGVALLGCREGECAWRLGIELTAARLAGEREPHLRASVRRERVRLLGFAPGEEPAASAALLSFRSSLLS